MNERHMKFTKWLNQTEYKKQSPRKAYLLSIFDKQTGKVCDIMVSENEPPYENRTALLTLKYPRQRYGIERMFTNLKKTARQ